MAKANKAEKPVEVTDEMPERELPSFSVTAKDLPAISGWEVGKMYTLEVKVEMVEMGKEQYGSDKGGVYGRFKVKEFVEAEPAEKESEEKADRAYMAKESEEK
jgi:hypothetical protein